MTSYFPERAPSSTSSSSTPSSPKAVNFAGVSGVSRPVTHEEQWACYYFELHAYECNSCRSPYERYKAGKRLCSEGNRLAAAMSGLLYRKDGQVYSRVKENGRMPRVEKPAQYDCSWSLLKAIEKGAKHQRPFLSAQKSEKSRTHTESGTRDRKDSLSPRTQQARPVSARKPSAPAETYARMPEYTLPLRQVHTTPVLDPYTAVQSTLQYNPFAYQEYEAAEPTNRGSLYETELARIIQRDERESRNAYKLDVPERAPKLSARGSVRRKSRPVSGLFF